MLTGEVLLCDQHPVRFVAVPQAYIQCDCIKGKKKEKTKQKQTSASFPTFS